MVKIARYMLAIVLVVILVWLMISLGRVAIELYIEHGVIVLVFGSIIAVALMAIVALGE